MYLANFERDDRLFDSYVNLLIFKQTCHICHCFNDSFDFQTFYKDGYIHHLWALFLIHFARILSLRSIHFATTHCSWVTKISSKNGNWKERWEGTREDWETISVVPSLHAIILSGSLKMLFGSPLPAIDITAHESLLTFDWH